MPRSRTVELYLHSAVRLHDVVHNYLSIGRVFYLREYLLAIDDSTEFVDILRVTKGKGKVVPVFNYAMKAYGGVDVKIHIFLTSALVGGEWSASRPGRFTPGERAPGTHCI
jgi:hypothetical protein